MDVAELSCLVCNINLEPTSCTNVYYTFIPRNGELLANFIVRVLRSVESNLRSPYVCSQCYNLFLMLEQAQWTATNIRSEIFKAYRSGNTDKAANDIQNGGAETVMGVDNKIFMEDFSDDDKIDITSTLDQLRDISNLRSIDDKEGQNMESHEASMEDQLAQQTLRTSKDSRSADIGCSKVIDQDCSKHNTKNASVPVRINSGATDTGNARNDKQSNHMKLEKPAEKSEDANTIANDSSGCTVANTDPLIIKEEMLSKAFTSASALELTENTLNLSRQEKMVLYTKQCPQCSRFFKSAYDLELHLLKHGGARPYECKKCMERFGDVSLANGHAMEMHVENENTICVATEPCKGEVIDFTGDDCILPEEILGMSDNDEQDDFEWKEASDNGSDIKDGSEGIKGNELGRDDVNSDKVKQSSVDSAQASWKSRRISKYSLKPLKHPCPTCGKKWRTSAELKTHMKSHSSLRPYMCEKCGQAYKHKHALEIHVGMHNGINPFQCSFCNKCFTQKGALMRHLPMHTGETPYQCELCGKRFVHHTSYNMHALSHTGKKSYRCHVCDLSLLSTSHLKRHMRVHTGEKPYSCPLCGKRFAERYNLFAHQKIHDPAEIMAKEAKKMQFKCEQCGISFDKKQKLDDHTKQHHDSSCLEPDNDTKWALGHTIDIEPQHVVELSKFYAPQNENQNQHSVKVDAQDGVAIGQPWQQLNYPKLQTMDSLKISQSQVPLTPIGPNSLTVALDNHRMLVEVGYSRNVLPNVGIAKETYIIPDKTQI